MIGRIRRFFAHLENELSYNKGLLLVLSKDLYEQRKKQNERHAEIVAYLSAIHSTLGGMSSRLSSIELNRCIEMCRMSNEQYEKAVE